HLMRKQIEAYEFAGLAKLQITSTLFSRVLINYNNLLFILSILLLFWNWVRVKKLFSVQNFLLLLMIVLLFGHAALLRMLDLPSFNFTAMIYIPLGIVILIGMRRHDLFSLYPIAQELILDNLKDGVVTVDSAHRLVDYNEAAKPIVYGYLQIRPDQTLH